jgi:hypothetical protein
MFHTPTPQELHGQLMKRFQELELQIIEVNRTLVEVRKTELNNNADVSTLIGDLAKVCFILKIGIFS